MSEYSLASLHGCSACCGRRQVILNYNPGFPECYSHEWQAAHDELFHRLRGLSLDCSGVEGGSSISSLGHQDYGSTRCELGYMGHL